MDFGSFLFVRTSYKATFLNRSDNTWHHLRLYIFSRFPPSSALPATYFPCRSTAETYQPTWSRAFHRRQHAFTWDRLLEDSRLVSSSAWSRWCVLTAAWLHIPDISFFALHIGPSSITFSTRFVVSAHSHVSVSMSLKTRVVTSSGHFHLRYYNTFLLTLQYSLQHLLVLMLSPSLLWRSFSLYQKITPYIRFRDW
jgi:hypothetical protein